VSRFLTADQHKYSAIHVGTCWKIQTSGKHQKQALLKLSTTQKKQTTQNIAKQNYPGSVAFYNIPPGNEVGLFYNAPVPTRGRYYQIHDNQLERSLTDSICLCPSPL